ncbi:MAG: helix-turn-helix domain-containing protein [Burkholderiaceae bacterium]|nr:helix-turn-helix domain-containing protein [Burkholderiaceae bacterium]
MSADRIARLHAIRDRHLGNEAANQRDRLLAGLHELGHVTTFEASRHLDIYDPRARKLELLRAGHDIVTVWRTATTESGAPHRIGVYLLRKGAGQ